MSKKYITLLLMYLFSCNTLPDSLGDNNELIIITSDEDREYISLSLSSITDNYINTPVEENIYNISWVDPNNFNEYMQYKNIIIASLTHPQDSTIDILNNKFHSSFDNENIFLLSNTYSVGQKIISINAHDSNHMDIIMKKYSNWIKDEFNDNIYDNILSSLISEQNNEIIEIIKNKYNFTLQIDENYNIIKEEDNFLWIGRGYPYRWLIFNKFKINNEIDYWEFLSSNLQENIKGLNIRNTYKKIMNYDNLMTIRGIYDYDISETGGPFFSYVFENNDNNEVILISGFVSNPGKDKWPLLNQLETIIKKTKVDIHE